MKLGGHLLNFKKAMKVGMRGIKILARASNRNGIFYVMGPQDMECWLESEVRI